MAVSSKMTLDVTVKISDQVAHRDLGGESVLLDLESGQYFGLNEVGSRVWNLLDQESSLTSIRDRLLKEFSVDAAILETDILNLVKNLADHGLVAIDRD